jgi:glycogen operon protein
MMRVGSLLALCLLAACGPSSGVRMYATSAVGPGLQAEGLQRLQHMGPTLLEKGTQFAVFSERATRMELLLFEDPESELPARRFPMERLGNVWALYVEGVGPGQHYGYVAWGPNWPYDPAWQPGSILGFQKDVDAEGNRFNPNKLLQDPYCKALHRDHDWARGNLASGPWRAESTWGAAAKCVVLRSEYAWGEGEAAYRERRKDPGTPGHRWSDMVVYEVHVKGFTANAASGVAHPGTYRGVGEKADYLKSLGITAVELLPVHEKPLDGTYWGYMSLNFFAPELSYASRPRWNEVTDEFKWMVEELHKRDIEVIVDVVYNHTGEGGFWRSKIEQSPNPDIDSQVVNLDEKEVASLYSYRGLDNAAYYALSADNQSYWNNTGVGNMTRCNAQPFRQLIMDSLRYQVEELHVDGFRFDLAPILGEADMDYNRWAPETSVLRDIVDDPVLNAWNTRVIAEPWDLLGFRLGGFPASSTVPGEGWGEWNAHFRDTWRQLLNERAWDWGQQKNVERRFNIGGEYWNGSGWQKDQPGLGEAFTGSAGVFGWNDRRPVHSLNFVTVHDGFTLYDLFSYDAKRNQCSPLNPICCEAPYSPFCDPDSGETNNHGRNWGDEPAKRQMVRNAFAAMLLSHGTPLILGGDEWMRTQLGNNNAYTTASDNAFNWFDWGAWTASDERHRMFDFVSQLTRFRREHAYALAPEQYGSAAPFAWKSPADTEGVDWRGDAVMVHFYDRTRGPELAILFNLADDDVGFTLPTGRAWTRVMDTQRYFDAESFAAQPGFPRKSRNISLDAPEPVNGAQYVAKAKSVVVLEAK